MRPASAAADLAVQQWNQLGVKVTPSGQDDTTATNTLFSTGNWDIAWIAAERQLPGPAGRRSCPARPRPTASNFAHIDNPGLPERGRRGREDSRAARAVAQWLAAESSWSATPTSSRSPTRSVKIFGKGAKFAVVGELLPTSIRMTGE